MKSELLTIDGIVNIVLGVLLVWYPSSVAAGLGLPTSRRSFFASVLGAVLFGIGVALLIERVRPSLRWVGLGLGGAVAINLCGAVVLSAWLVGGTLALTTLGSIVLWALVAGLVGLSIVELYTQVRQPTG